MRLLNSNLRWYRDRLIALSACALVALSVAFGFLPRLAVAATSSSPVPVTNLTDARCLHTNPENTFFLALEANRTTPNPNGYSPADNSTVAPGTPVSSWFSDETGLNLGSTDSTKTPVLTLTKTGPGGFIDNITPLTIGADMGSLSFDNAHRECYHQNNITGTIPTLHAGSPLPPGDYTASLTAWDKDTQNGGGPDKGNHTWSFHIKAQPKIGTTPSAGGAIGTAVHDSATVTGGDSPGGTVTFNLYAPGDTGCLSTVVFTDTQNLGVVSGNYTTAAVGTYHWKATYNGDPNNLTATSACDAEPVTTIKAQPSIGTTPSAGGTVGTAIHDTASVTGGQSPTGNVTFNLYAPGDLSCESAPVFTDTKALGVASGNYTTAAVGIYRWTATYNGDANNLTATSGCQDEKVTVGSAEQVAAAAAQQVAAAAAQQVLAAAVTLPKAGAGPQQQGSSAPGGGGPFGASGIVTTLLLALIGSVLFALRRRQSGEAEEPKA